jgi:hypothetical protein
MLFWITPLLLPRVIRDQVIDYVLSRRCEGGGFCFYKLEEPNGSDSYHALSILDLLGVPFQDEKTVDYLQTMQHGDGTYDSVFSSFYSIRGLQLLKREPRHHPEPYIWKHLDHFALDVRKLPPEIHSIFKRLLYVVELYFSLEMERDERIEKNIVDFVLSFQNEDRGFGTPSSNLTDTAKALVMLDRFGYPLGELESERFIRQCGTPLFGFTDIPRRSLSYLEYIHAGVLASAVISHRPRYFDRCADFILNCRNRNGGFSRVPHAGIATMEDTYFAVHALKLLSALEKKL